VNKAPLTVNSVPAERMPVFLPGVIIPVDHELRLRELGRDDAPAMFDIIEKNRDYLLRWLPDFEYIKTAADYADFLQDLATGRQEEKECGFGIELHQKLVGHISLHNMVQSADMCYWVDKQHCGRGIATRAVRALTKFAFEELGLKRVALVIEPANIASNQVASKAGYTLRAFADFKINQFNHWTMYDHELYGPNERW